MNTAVAERPDQRDYQPVEKAKTIGDALRAKDTITRFQQAMPKHLSAERMLRICALAVYKTPDLAKCEVMSLLGAMLSLASLGLEPNTELKHAWLIPFKSRRRGPNGWEDFYQVQVIIGYRGLIELARRAGTLVSIHADVVYGKSEVDGLPADTFDFEYGSNMHLKHIPNGSDQNPRWAYAYAKLADGEAFDVLPYNRVMKIRNKAQGYIAALNAKTEAGNDPTKAYLLKTYESNPWVAFEHEMAAKTMIRRLSKGLPMSIEFMRAVELDEASDASTIDFAAMARSTELIEHTPIVPFEPPEERREPETVEQTPVPGAEKIKAATKPRPKPPAPPPADPLPASPPPPPPPPPPEPAQAGPEREPLTAVQPEILPAAFELQTGDGEVLEWTDWADFPEAYKAELGRAFSGFGVAGGEGFHETNRATFLEWAKNNHKQAAELDVYFAGLVKSYTPPDEPSGQTGGSGLF